MLMMQDYTAKPEVYFDNVRREIAELLPPHSQRVLEVGCGAGATLQWLKRDGYCEVTVGMELFDAAAAIARQRLDQVVVGNAEQLIDQSFGPATFDLVLCLDVLEHLIDPWLFITKLERLLKPGGTLISNIPNIRHLRVLLPLLVAGRWQYAESGILDRTHLRFFTRNSALELMSPPGLRVTRWLRRMAPRTSPSGVANLATLGLLKDMFAMSYLIASRKG